METNTKNKLISIGLYFLPIVLFVWVAYVNRFPEGYTFTAGDFSQPRNIQQLFFDFFYVWNGKVAAIAEGGFFSWFAAIPFYFIFYFLPSKLGLSESLMPSFVLFSFLSLSYLSFLFALKLLFRNKSQSFTVLLSLFYAVSPITLYFFTYAWGPSHQVFLYTFIPLLTALFIKILETSRVKYILLFLIVLFFSVPSYTNSAFALSLSVFLLLVFILSLILRIAKLSKSLVKSLLSLGLGTLGIVSYWLLPTSTFIKMGLAALDTKTGVFDLASWLKAHSSDVLSILLNTSNYLHNYPFRYEGVTLSLVMFIPTFIFAASLLKKSYQDTRERRLLLLFVVVGFVFSLLVKKVNPPLSNLTVQMFKLPLLSTLRSYEKTGVFLPFTLLIPIYIFVTNLSSKKDRGLVFWLLIVALVAVRPYFTGGIQTKYSIAFPKGENYLTAEYSMLTKVPDEYFELVDISNEDNSDTRVLSAPFGPLNSISWVNYPEWQMIGNDPIPMFFSKNVLSANSPQYLSYGWHPHEFFNKSAQNPEWYVNLLSLLNASEIIYHKDVNPKFVDQTLSKMERLEEQGLISAVARTEYADLYQIDPSRVLPHFYIPQNFIVSTGGLDSLALITSLDDYQLLSGIYFTNLEKKFTSLMGSDGNFTSNSQVFISPEKVAPLPDRRQLLSEEETEELVMPNARILPDSFFYFYVERKESKLIEREEDIIARTDSLLWLSGKWVVEIEKLLNKGEIEVAKATFRRYLDQLEEMVETLGRLSEERMEAYRLIGKAQRYFIKHSSIIEKASVNVDDPSFSEDLSRMDDLHQKVNLLAPLKDHNLYLLQIPYQGIYSILLRGGEDLDRVFTANPLNKIDFILDREREVSIDGVSKGNGWYEYQNAFSSTGFHSLYLPNFQPKNLIENGSFEDSTVYARQPVASRYEEAVEGKYSLKLAVGVDEERELIFPVKDFVSGYQYHLSFYYKSMLGEPLRLGIWQDTDLSAEEAEEESDMYSYYASLSPTPLWQKVELDFGSAVGASEMKVVIKLLASEDKSIALIDDLRVERIFNPDLIVRRDEPLDQQDQPLPNLTFVKINPTRYRVLVEGAYSPYTLAFSETFNSGWKVYINKITDEKFRPKADQPLAEKVKSYGNVTASYFEGQVREGEHQRAFWDNSFLQTWLARPLPEDRHYLINGYANSWYITSEDADGQSDYEIIVEFWPQRLFYLGLVISGIGFLTCVVYLFFTFKNRRSRV